MHGHYILLPNRIKPAAAGEQAIAGQVSGRSLPGLTCRPGELRVSTERPAQYGLPKTPASGMRDPCPAATPVAMPCSAARPSSMPSHPPNGWRAAASSSPFSTPDHATVRLPPYWLWNRKVTLASEPCTIMPNQVCMCLGSDAIFNHVSDSLCQAAILAGNPGSEHHMSMQGNTRSSGAHTPVSLPRLNGANRPKSRLGTNKVSTPDLLDSRKLKPISVDENVDINNQSHVVLPSPGAAAKQWRLPTEVSNAGSPTPHEHPRSGSKGARGIEFGVCNARASPGEGHLPHKARETRRVTRLQQKRKAS